MTNEGKAYPIRIIRHGDGTATVRVGYTMESGRVRRGDLRSAVECANTARRALLGA